MIGDPMNPQAPLEGRFYQPGETRAQAEPNARPSLSAEAQNPDWLGLAREAFEASETWMNANTRQAWMRNLAAYRNEHPAGSPFYSDAYRHRAKYFRPITRGLVRSIQSAAAQAFFSSADIVSLDPEDDDNPIQADAAKLMKHLLNYRLDKTLPWYRIVLGAIADAAVLGSVVSHQCWEFEEEVVSETENPLTGEVVKEVVLRKDKPHVRLVPAENFRISPAADWLDPVGTSPYVIELIPMFVCDVMERMTRNDQKTGEPRWRQMDESAVLSLGAKTAFEPVRMAREGKGRIDPKATNSETVQKFRVIWVHRNIVRWNGKDWLYYTASTNALLSDPVPLADVIPWAEHGERDYVAGALEIETDRPYPAGPVELIQGLQGIANEIRNQRTDNVRQVMNSRLLVKSNASTDLQALMRNVPGSAITTNDPVGDVRELTVKDVTASSYNEEDRVNLDIDDLTGRMSGSTVQSNRRLNETVGGMELMAQGGTQVREMELRNFVETWYEPVLRQLCRLEAYYETDAIALSVASKRAGLQEIMPEYFEQQFPVKVNVGMGATNPAQRLNRFVLAVRTAVELVPNAAGQANAGEITKEIFANAGYEDGSRFFNFDQPAPAAPDARAEALQAQNAIRREELALKGQIEKQKLVLAAEKQRAEIDKTTAETTAKNIDAMYSATQAAGIVALNPAAAVAADALLRSGGFKDHDAPPIVPQVPAPAAGAVQPANTHPAFPPRPVSPDVGMLAGHEAPGAMPWSNP